MKKWIAEDWEFEIVVIEGKAEHCRMGCNIFEIAAKVNQMIGLACTAQKLHLLSLYTLFEINS